MEWNEGYSIGGPLNLGDPQVYDVAEGGNPRIRMCTCAIDGGETTQGEDANVMSGRVGGIWKGLGP